ncbi:MAG: 3-methyl-2-oxobutanoate dehydrogenase subunit VorB [Desulfobacterota bacterium]|nr:3-methyl-2-oxobutanoate dehydrogenase subunit VorB [Thermodesulfobacteriota bacterium]
MNKQLMYGTHALAEAAIQAGCTCYFGYPITPQNELPEYMAQRLTEIPGGVFIQAESELAAINMVLGASAAGARALTSSSSPGISLKQEGISFMAGMELPAVIANIMRGGPGLGNIAPSQADYFQATRGGGHGDYRIIVLAPGSVQEIADLTFRAFDLADTYRIPVMILGDGMLGQLMEPVIIPKPRQEPLPEKDYIVSGAQGRQPRVIKSLILDTREMEEHNWKLFRKYQLIQQRETRWESYLTDDAELIVIAYGTAARIAKGAIKRLRKDDPNMKIGLLRPITLWPFPTKAIKESLSTASDYFVFEMSAGQMVDDVLLSLEGKGRVHFYGRPGGIVPTPAELARSIARRYYQMKRTRKR